MSTEIYDLWFDPNSVDGDMVVECWISNGPRSDDEAFSPEIGDWVTVGDGEDHPLRAEVIRRTGDRVSVRIDLGSGSSAVA